MVVYGRTNIAFLWYYAVEHVCYQSVGVYQFSFPVIDGNAFRLGINVSAQVDLLNGDAGNVVSTFGNIVVGGIMSLASLFSDFAGFNLL